MWRLLGLLLLARVASATIFTPAVTNDCSADVTAGLNTFFSGTVTNGTALVRNTVQFTGCYRIDGTVTVPQKSFLNIQGPAELRAVAAMSPGGSRAVLSLDRGSDLSITDLTLRATNADKGAYDGTLEHEYTMTILGTSRVRVNRLFLHNMHGDGISISPGGSWDGNGVGATIADDVIIQNSRFYSTGRHGVTITAGSNILISRNAFDEIGYLGIDQEVEAPAWYARNVTVDSNTFGKVHIGAFSSSGFIVAQSVALQTDHITLSHNRVLNALDTCIPAFGFTTNSQGVNNVSITKNKLNANGSPLFVGNGQHVLISGNRATGVSCGGGGAGVTVENGNDITIDSNVWVNAPASWRVDPGNPTHVPTNLSSTNNMCQEAICSAAAGS